MVDWLSHLLGGLSYYISWSPFMIGWKFICKYHTDGTAGSRAGYLWFRHHTSFCASLVWWYEFSRQARQICEIFQLRNCCCLRWYRSLWLFVIVSSCRIPPICKTLWRVRVCWCWWETIWPVRLMTWASFQSSSRRNFIQHWHTFRSMAVRRSLSSALIPKTPFSFIFHLLERLLTREISTFMRVGGRLMTILCIMNVGCQQALFGSSLTYVWALLITRLRQLRELQVTSRLQNLPLVQIWGFFQPLATTKVIATSGTCQQVGPLAINKIGWYWIASKYFLDVQVCGPDSSVNVLGLWRSACVTFIRQSR